jgi:hypothetical protein
MNDNNLMEINERFNQEAEIRKEIERRFSALIDDKFNAIKIEISKETQSYYDYEMELNESKRSIKLLKPEFVSAVEEEFRRVIV